VRLPFCFRRPKPRLKPKVRRILALALIPCAVAPLTSRCAAAGSDWPEYLGGPGRRPYSTLKQVNTRNVGSLKIAWEYHSGDVGAMERNPIIVDDVRRGYGTSATTAIGRGVSCAPWMNMKSIRSVEATRAS
jgi:hypothetical protein